MISCKSCLSEKFILKNNKNKFLCVVFFKYFFKEWVNLNKRLDPGDLGLKAIRLSSYLGPLFGTPMDPFGPIKT
jgi:hypothetical protein